MKRARSLIYHDVVEPGRDDASGFPGADATHYKLTVGAFEAHLAALARSGRAPVASVGDDQVRSGRCPIVLTFDDGGASALTEIAPRLEARGWRGLFFVTTDRIGERGFVTASDLVALADRGHAIGTHSASHPERFSHLDDAAMLAEWQRSRAALEAILGRSVRLGSVPGGFYSRRVGESAARAGLEVLFTSEPMESWHTVGPTWIAGRYSVTRRTSPDVALALATGARRETLKQLVTWELKKAAKRALGPAWLEARRRFFASRGAS
jgi:peptidoglycan/xylan/chitin deacetylase (PgdA/CDA1 family)